MRAAAWIAALVAGAGWAALQVLLWTQILPATGGVWPLDLRVTGYGPEEVRRLLEALTPEAYALLTGPVRIIDTIFPVALATLLALLARLPGRSALAVAGMAAAMLYGAADLGENAAVARLLDTALLPDPAEVRLASTLTVTKYAAVAVAALLAALSWRRGRR